jgi:IS5 family transposase
MHQTKKGNQWYFGMKAHIGVDAKSGLTHSLVTTAANEHDLNQVGKLLHGDEEFISADAGYQGPKSAMSSAMSAQTGLSPSVPAK